MSSVPATTPQNSPTRARSGSGAVASHPSEPPPLSVADEEMRMHRFHWVQAPISGTRASTPNRRTATTRPGRAWKRSAGANSSPTTRTSPGYGPPARTATHGRITSQTRNETKSPTSCNNPAEERTRSMSFCPEPLHLPPQHPGILRWHQTRVGYMTAWCGELAPEPVEPTGQARASFASHPPSTEILQAVLEGLRRL